MQARASGEESVGVPSRLPGEMAEPGGTDFGQRFPPRNVRRDDASPDLTRPARIR